MTDPTRTEDVEEWELDERFQSIGDACRELEMRGEKEHAQWIHDDLLVLRAAFRDLRSRLEEAEAERDRWKKAARIRREEREEMWEAANSNLREARATRRRADRLEGVVREAKDLADYVYDRTFWRLNPDDDGNHHVDREMIDGMYKRASRVRDTVAALDSREDEGEKGRSLDLEYARTNEMVDESVTMGAPSPMPLGYMVMSSIPDDCRGCTWETLSGTGRVEKWILEERDPDCPVHADEPEGDEGMTDVQKARCIAYREGFGDGYDYARETDPPTDEPVSGEGDGGECSCPPWPTSHPDPACPTHDDARSEVPPTFEAMMRSIGPVPPERYRNLQEVWERHYSDLRRLSDRHEDEGEG